MLHSLKYEKTFYIFASNLSFLLSFFQILAFTIVVFIHLHQGVEAVADKTSK